MKQNGLQMRFESSSDYKQRVKKSFQRAALTYEKHASLQKKTANYLFNFVLPYFCNSPRSLLEVGCGTGFLSKLIAEKWPKSILTLADLSPAMIEVCRGKMGPRIGHYLVGDGENDKFIGAPFDLIFSNLTFQWFYDIQKGITNLWNQTQNLAFSTLLKGSFNEWKKVDPSLEKNDFYLSEEELKNLCCNEYRARCFFCFSEESEYYSTPLDWMRHLKNIGANTPSFPHAPHPLFNLSKLFPEGITINYRIAYCLMMKKL